MMRLCKRSQKKLQLKRKKASRRSRLNNLRKALRSNHPHQRKNQRLPKRSQNLWNLHKRPMRRVAKLRTNQQSQLLKITDRFLSRQDQLLSLRPNLKKRQKLSLL